MRHDRGQARGSVRCCTRTRAACGTFSTFLQWQLLGQLYRHEAEEAAATQTRARCHTEKSRVDISKRAKAAEAAPKQQREMGEKERMQHVRIATQKAT
jgi:hypothetical protein